MQIPMSKERPLGSLLVAWPRKDPKLAARASDHVISQAPAPRSQVKAQEAAQSTQDQEKQLTGQNYVVKIISRNLEKIAKSQSQ